ncbi:MULTISPECIES: hypothetical protein [unclassified Microbacterium]|uniref:hypothetical protein n=1 Tax=unclassified Microbacterium TaxID=2609290 RepID=UPI000EAA3485|nr:MULTISPECIES: hypothetical protein [unclassified Microbacterium]MBT2486936.1 hypothetical protein [Microbacterium sp. ISL-108]RKN64338.1 hypothetical protein D7252_19770 [Microbacterium sp. CGR2]
MSDPVVVAPIKGYLGGEDGHRSFFGGQVSKARLWSVGLSIGIGLVLVLLFQGVGLAIMLVSTVASFVLTTRTHRGSILERRRKRRRWKKRVQAGTDSFRPYSVAEWDQAEADVRQAKGRRARWEASRRLASIRLMPDGADAMGWLQKGRRQPGIAWHSPSGETPYLSVAFSVTGMHRGIESTDSTNKGTLSFGSLLAEHAGPESLARNVQSVTRIVPADTALYEYWVRQNVDGSIPDEAQASYKEVLRITSENAMVQRHFYTVSWPLTAQFINAAEKFGNARDGWRALMAAEIEEMAKKLAAARLGVVEVFTARQVAGVVKHLQNPGHPIDMTAGVDPTSFGVASHDEFSAYVTEGTDVDGNPVQWWHRTAKITAGSLSTGARTPLWMLPLLVGTHLKMIRTFSFHHQLVPAVEAKAAAIKDLVRDEARRISDAEGGRLADDTTAVAATAAAQRIADFRPGTGHEGDYWVGYLTITETSRDRLAQACRTTESVCHSKAGIERIEWLDSYQAAAAGTTWPIGRGIRMIPPTASAKFYRRLAGRSQKDELT